MLCNSLLHCPKVFNAQFDFSSAEQRQHYFFHYHFYTTKYYMEKKSCHFLE